MPIWKSAPLRILVVAASLSTVLGLALADYSGGSSGGYVVEAGDSLWSIASAHGTTVAELASLNHLDPGAVLPIGAHLTLPGQIGPAGPGEAPVAVCSSAAESGPWGVLPAQLAASPDRLALEPIFREWAGWYGVSQPLLEAIAWQESGWQEGVVSPTGAVGVGQIEPGTGQFIAQDLIGEPMDPASVSDNIRMSAAFVAYLERQEGGSVCATIAAYYQGPLTLQAYGMLPSTTVYVADVEALLPRFE